MASFNINLGGTFANIREEDIPLHAQNIGREQEVKWFQRTTKFVLRSSCSTWLMLPLQIWISS